MNMSKAKKNWILLGILCSLLLLRAWPRLLYPGVWVEDGTLNFYGFVTRGLIFFTEPQNGYYFVIPKIITALSASVSAYFYPEIATLLTILFTVAILVMLVRLPLHLRGGIWLAIVCLLIPAWGECFALPSYTFWWASLLLFAFIFWDEQAAARYIWFRIIAIALASLSAPVCLVTLPLFWARVIWFWQKPNRNTEILIACPATLCAAIQLIPVLADGKGKVGANVSTALSAINPIVTKFLGGYVLGNLLPKFAAIAGIAALIYIIAGMVRHRRNVWLWALCYLWLAAILMSIARVNIHIIGPMGGGPRYFFYPYLLLGWLTLQFVFIDENRYFRLAGLLVLILSVANALPCLPRGRIDRLPWRNHLLSCQHFPNYTIPIHFAGKAHFTWNIGMSGENCQQIRQNDFFSRAAIGLKTFPYRVSRPESKNLLAAVTPAAKDIVENQWQGGDHWTAVGKNNSIPPGWNVFGSFSTIGQHRGVLSIRCRRGDQLLFAAGPRLDRQRIKIAGHPEFADTAPFWVGGDKWALLEFSNDLLPETFVVRFYDLGSERQEWSAIAIKKEGIALPAQ